MRVLKMVCFCVVIITCVAHAKNTYSAFSLGRTLPLSSAAPTRGSDKALEMGWEGAWTFFGLPFAKSESALSGLAFGGKISYNRWLRDSTLTELTVLGTQGIVRYYAPLEIKPFDLFVQAGLGMFIGEHGFADPDTLYQYPIPSGITVIEGKKNIGVSFNVGMNWDVFEVSPGMTIVLTQGKSSAWFSINAAMKF
jgi:hypothetical protein